MGDVARDRMQRIASFSKEHYIEPWVCLTDCLGDLHSTLEADKTSLTYLNRWSSLGPSYTLASSDWWRIFFLCKPILQPCELWSGIYFWLLNSSSLVLYLYVQSWSIVQTEKITGRRDSQ